VIAALGNDGLSPATLAETGLDRRIGSSSSGVRM
jgi:hypothetical protein